MTKPSKRGAKRICKKRRDSGSARQLPAKSSLALSDITDHKVASAAASAKKTKVRKLTLRAFVEEAWQILEPVSSLVWNWHLDLICEYLTLIRDEDFKSVCGDLEGIIFNVPRGP